MRILRFAAMMAAALLIGVSDAHAQTTLALWSMPTAFPAGTGLVPTGTTYLPPNGSFGDGTPAGGLLVGDASAILSAFHSIPAATYTSPLGNGSQYSFSSNNWSPSDYYQIFLPTTGKTNLSVSWDQARSSTGPAPFALQMSSNGTDFTELTVYSVFQSGGGGAPGTWTSGSYNALYTNTFALPLAAENQSTLYLRFINQSGTVSSSSGSNRIDSISVTSVPEPATIALLGLGIAALAGLNRRRGRGRSE